MHIRVFIEDRSGKIALDHVLLKLFGDPHTYDVLSWKGIGRLPRNLEADPDPRKRTLLDKLPALLRASAKEFQDYDGSVIVVVDVDRRNQADFLQELEAVIVACDPKPIALFRLAVEEGEAWLLGDQTAVSTAYPAAKKSGLDAYVQDSICGTWEVLANAIYPGGAAALDKSRVAYSVIGSAKCEWADKIARHIAPYRNTSPSFQHLVSGVASLIAKEQGNIE